MKEPTSIGGIVVGVCDWLPASGTRSKEMTEDLMRTGALLDLTLKKGGLLWDRKVKDSLGCSDHKMVEFRILKEGIGTNRSSWTNPGLKECRVWPLCGSSCHEKGPRGKKSPVKLVDIQGSTLPSSKLGKPKLELNLPAVARAVRASLDT